MYLYIVSYHKVLVYNLTTRTSTLQYHNTEAYLDTSAQYIDLLTFHSPKCRNQRPRQISLHQVPIYPSQHLSYSHINKHTQNLFKVKISQFLLFMILWFQDIQLRILPPKESCSTVRRRKERGASLRDGKHLMLNDRLIDLKSGIDISITMCNV